MKLKNKDVIEKKREFPISKVLYVIASIVGIMGVALLADNIYIFKSTIDQYVTQGYTTADVVKGLIPSQLIPGIFEPIAIYGGIAFILLGVGIANKKISEHLIPLVKVENQDDILEKSISEKNLVDAENAENTENKRIDIKES